MEIITGTARWVIARHEGMCSKIPSVTWLCFLGTCRMKHEAATRFDSRRVALGVTYTGKVTTNIERYHTMLARKSIWCGGVALAHVGPRKSKQRNCFTNNRAAVQSLLRSRIHTAVFVFLSLPAWRHTGVDSRYAAPNRTNLESDTACTDPDMFQLRDAVSGPSPKLTGNFSEHFVEFLDCRLVAKLPPPILKHTLLLPLRVHSFLLATNRFVESNSDDSRVSAMVLRSLGDEHEAASSPYRHVGADTPKSVISAERFLVACGTRPVR